MFKMLATAFNWANVILIVFVLIWSEEVTNYLNELQRSFNEDEAILTDGGHVLKILLNKWEGIALSGSLVLLFFVRKIFEVLGNTVRKITK